ncbi:DUF4079 family protein [Desulfovibrio oxyclinae]|jgi:hypothetical protein|uniref:DUF4079 family protein n=1 Tax=Desulfovibrio oxyclinae TaxID=63560 RepID=UPI000380FBBF|nr:DUF4079 family protein [Desulfovibrio oxyclinae]
MLYFHPVFQAVATLLALYALTLGFRRFQFNHLKKRVAFNWKRHVFVGRLALGMWMLGMVGGLMMARIYWSTTLLTGLHWQVAFWMLPLILFGFATGEVMNRLKEPRKILPLLHGLNNLILICLALFQFYTGWHVLKDFVL